MTTTQQFAVSRHAVDRALDMGVEGDEIRDAFERPRDRHASTRTDSHWLTRGRITLCVRMSPEGVPTVTTILWAKPSGWVADAEFDPIEGRSNQEDNRGSRRVARARKRRRT